MFTSRLRCHFCGTRSTYPKDAQQFQCTACEAMNFFDGKGNVIDAPASVVTQPQTSFRSRSRYTSPEPALERSAHQQQSVFCRSCVQNQLLYTQALANYLPDEDHPRYREIEAALPRYRKELEKRYPQVCKKCAPLAQSNISRADYYSKTQLMSKLASERKARKGKPIRRVRDNPKKKIMRLLLNLAGTLSLAALLVQAVFHLYGMLLHLFVDSNIEVESSELLPDLSVRICARRALSMQTDQPCFDLFSSSVPQSIALSAIMLWYNPGMKAWYHHTIRMETVKGQWQYFWTHVLLIMIRCVAWYQLSNPAMTAAFDRKQLAMLHFSAALLMSLPHIISTQAIKPVAWKMRGNIMPRPEERDVLGSMAGPEPDRQTPRASEKDPWRYLKRQSIGAFDINNLAPHAARSSRKAPSQWSEAQFPSPEATETSDTEPDEDDDDAMETDFKPVMRSSFQYSSQPGNHELQRGAGNHLPQPQQQTLGWSDVRGEIFSMQDQMRAETERRAREQQSAQPVSPFRGKLPLAPMSVERRLRNPVSPPAAKPEIPLSQQKNFFSQMSTGIAPVTFPEKGSSLELRKSRWTLPGDVRETGLEDLMAGNSFRIDDEPDLGQGTKALGWFSSWLGRND